MVEGSKFLSCKARSERKVNWEMRASMVDENREPEAKKGGMKIKLEQWELLSNGFKESSALHLDNMIQFVARAEQ